MCLAVPACIVSRSGDDAVVEIQGVARQASLALIPEAEVGDWVLLHAGFAIERLDESAARETMKLLEEVQAAAGAPVPPRPGTA